MDCGIEPTWDCGIELELGLNQHAGSIPGLNQQQTYYSGFIDLERRTTLSTILTDHWILGRPFRHLAPPTSVHPRFLSVPTPHTDCL